MDKSFNLVDAIRVLLKWKWAITGFVIAVSITSVIVTWFFMDNYYESKAVFYPMNLSANDRSSVFGTQGSDMPAERFGTKNDINRLLTIANSSEVVDYIVNDFNLMEHYDYDTSSSRFKRYKVTEEFRDNYEVIKTENMAIEISVVDVDTTMAKEMMEKIIVKIDDMNKRRIASDEADQLEKLQAILVEKTKALDTQTDSLAQLKKKYDIVEVTLPGEEGVTIKGNDPEQVLKYEVLKSKQLSAIESLNDFQTVVDQLSAVNNGTRSSIYLIEKPQKGEKKVSPKRSVICISAFLVALFFGIIGALLLERVQEIRRELANDPA